MAEYGFVLSSDGSKSSFEIGAWKALRELNLKISAVSGSFVGALNAALIAQGDFERAVRFWRNVSAKNLFYVNRHIAQKYTDEWSKTETKHFRKNFVSYVTGKSEELAPLKEMIDMFISESDVRASDMHLGFVSISLTNLEAEMITLNKIPRGKLSQYLLAASTFPQIAQVNRAKDPQFSLEFSPYWIIQGTGCTRILSTDDLLIIPPSLKADVAVIYSSEAMEFSLSESLEQMKSNIKLGYTDTLKMFERSIGSSYLIRPGSDSELTRFTAKFNNSLPAHLNDLVRILLRLRVLGSNSITDQLKNLMAESNANPVDFQIALLENLAKFTGVKNDARFTPNKLFASCIEESKKKLEAAKQQLTDVKVLKEALASIENPAQTYPDPDLFIKYFLILLSTKPEKYTKFRSFFANMHPRTAAAIVCLIYAYYA